jgi:hypothetical protein
MGFIYNTGRARNVFMKLMPVVLTLNISPLNVYGRKMYVIEYILNPLATELNPTCNYGSVDS